MIFHFGEQELTPTIEEVESFQDWEHCLGINVTIPTHKPSYLKGFHTLDISKASLPKEAIEEYLHYPFNLLLKEVGRKLVISPTPSNSECLL